MCLTVQFGDTETCTLNNRENGVSKDLKVGKVELSSRGTKFSRKDLRGDTS